MKICMVPSDMDAPGFYRMLSPGRQLSEHGVEVFMPPRELKEWEDDEGKKRQRHIFDVDLVLPQSADLYVWQQWKERILAEKGVGRLRKMGCATSIDVDDNYVNLPEYNPAFYGTHPYKRDDGVILNRRERRSIQKRTHFKPPPNRHNRLHLLSSISQVDMVTVSTPHLANAYEPYHKNIKVIRNYVDWDIWEDITPQYEVERERLRIGYFGVFRYRRGDLQVIQRVLPRFLRDHPEVDFVTNSEETHDYLGVPEGQRITLGEYDFYDYETGNYLVGEMTAQCDIGLVPLLLNDLNQSKSHLKGMEYNAAGIPFIASPTESYKDFWCQEGGNGYLATTEDDWYSHMKFFVEHEQSRKIMGATGRRNARANSIQQNWRVWHNAYAELIGGEHHAIARRAIGVGAVQKVSELAPVLKIVAQEKPKTIVEIGTAQGGTFWALAQTAPDDAMLISIDIPAGSPIDVRDGKDVYEGRNRDNLKHFVKPTQTLKLIDMNSQTPAAYATLKHALEGRQIDLLFIDGDHRYEGVKHDYETYSQLVRPGGMICFHDIVTHEDKRVGVHLLWSEIEDGLEFLGPETWGFKPWGGIGVAFKHVHA